METRAMKIETLTQRQMRRSPRWAGATLALAAGLSLAPVAGRAQDLTTTVCNNSTPIERLSPQEREMLTLVTETGKKISDAIEKWLVSREVTEDRLFSFLYYPIAKSDPPKFNTEWDHLSDRDLQEIEETALTKSANITYVVFVDKYGYLPTHNRKFSLPTTGNYAQDLTNNRTKRMFSDRTGLAASQNQQPCLIQPYKRDTGEILYDISVPVRVREQHFGALRIGYRPVAAPR
jgi:hypothetical protein